MAALLHQHREEDYGGGRRREIEEVDFFAASRRRCDVAGDREDPFSDSDVKVSLSAAATAAATAVDKKLRFDLQGEVLTGVTVSGLVDRRSGCSLRRRTGGGRWRRRR